MAHADAAWAPLVARQADRLAELTDWGPAAPAPPRWRILEAWTVAAHGPQMACAGGFRLAFYAEERPNHGPRLDRALARYARHAAAAAPPGWPHSPIAGLTRWIATCVPRQDGPEHGIALDIARFDRFTKQMAAYAAWRHPDYLARAAARARARRRQVVAALAQQVNLRLAFRLPDATPAARLQTAAALLASSHPGHRATGRALYARAAQEERLRERDRRLVAGRAPGLADERSSAAARHAECWGLPMPEGGR